MVSNFVDLYNLPASHEVIMYLESINPTLSKVLINPTAEKARGVAASAVSSFILSEMGEISEAIAECRKNFESDPEVVERIVKYRENPSGLPVLHYFVKAGDETAVQAILEAGYDPNARANNEIQFSRDEGFTPIEIAIDNGNAILTSLLLDYGADPYSLRGTGVRPLEKDPKKYTAFSSSILIALTKKHYEILRILVEHRVDFNKICRASASGKNSKSGFDEAFISGDPKIIAIVLGYEESIFSH